MLAHKDNQCKTTPNTKKAAAEANLLAVYLSMVGSSLQLEDSRLDLGVSILESVYFNHIALARGLISVVLCSRSG